MKPALWSCALSGAGLIGCSADVAPVVDPTPQSGGSANTSGSGGGFGKFGSGGTSSPSGGAFGSGATGGAAPAGTGGSGGDSAGSAGSAASAGSGGSGGAPVYDFCLNATRTALPLVVTEHYYPTGYYDTSGSELASPAEACPTRAEGAAGTCLTFEWTPATRDWVGVLFQNEPGVWTGNGLCIAEGATKVVFKARGETGGEVASFGVVGVDLENQALTTEWTDYEIDLTAVDYNDYNVAGGVNGGFSIVMARTLTDTAVRRIHVDDIRWIAE